jgi:hypothetical protein
VEFANWTEEASLLSLDCLPLFHTPFIEASMQPWRPALGSVLRAWRRNVLNRPQRTQRRLLRPGQSLHPADIEPLVGPATPQHPQMLATLGIPHLNGIVIATAGQSPAIGTCSQRLDRPLMSLPKRQALSVLHVPPAQVPIAAATEQHLSSRTPG